MVLTVRAQGGPVSERERRGRPRSTGITGGRGGRGRGGSGAMVPPGSNGGHQSTWRTTTDAYGMSGVQGDDGGRGDDGERRRARSGSGEGGSGVDLGERDRRRGREGERGRVGEGPEEVGALAALSFPVAGEGVRRGPAPVPTPVGGTGKGRERPSEVGQAGSAWGSAQLGQGPVGGVPFPLFSVCFLCCIFFSFYLHLFFLMI